MFAKEPFSGNSNTTKTFTRSMESFVISHDGNVGDPDITFTINGDTFTIKQGEIFDEMIEPFQMVTVTTTVPFRAYGRRD